MIHSSQEWQGTETLSVLGFIADRKNRKTEMMMMMSIHTKLYKRIFRFYHIVFTKLTLNSKFFLVCCEIIRCLCILPSVHKQLFSCLNKCETGLRKNITKKY